MKTGAWTCLAMMGVGLCSTARAEPTPCVLRYFTPGKPAPFRELTRVYDGQGKLSREVQWLEANGGLMSNQHQYDDHGRLIREENTYGGVATYRYDAQGRLSEKREFVGEPGHGYRISYRYDQRGRLTQEERYLEGRRISRIDYRYDPQGRLITATESGQVSGMTSYEYDAQGRRASKTQKLSRQTLVTRYRYDEEGRLVQEDNGSVRVEYDYRCPAPPGATTKGSQ